MSRLGRFFSAGLTAASLFIAVRARAEEPWQKGPFTAEPSALLAAAAAASPGEGDDAIVLLDDARYTFDAEGRCVSRHRLVFQVLTPAGQEEWSSLVSDWAPWHQERPEITARVVTKDGAVHALDPKTVTEGPARDFDPDLYSDRRIVRAPLPAVAPGAVVEQEIVLREKAPMFDAGVVHAFVFGRSATVLKTSLRLQFPASRPLRTAVRGKLTLSPKRTEEGGTVTLVYEAGRLEPEESFEPGLPGELSPVSAVSFATGKSWNDVARRYAEIVDRQIAGHQAAAAARDAVKGAQGTEAIVNRLLALLERDVRYTGIEFGESSIVPRPPAETLKQKYGDCKDKAALLTAMLREAGIAAHVALLRTGRGIDTDPALPGLGFFDHAIVYVPGPPALWIDPTDDLARAGQLPLADQGRQALVADASTTGLIETPASRSEDNRTVEIREFFLPERGKARVVETSDSWGSVELEQRHYFNTAEKKQIKEQLEDYARTVYLTKGTVKTESSEPRDLTKPFRIRLEGEEAGRGVTEEGAAVVGILPSLLTNRLPSVITAGGDDDEEEADASKGSRKKRKQRSADFVFAEPFVTEWRYRIVPPTGYTPGPLPESGERAMGPAKLTKKFELGDAGVVTATLRFDSGKRRISAAEFEAMRKGVQEFRKAPAILVRYEQTAAAHLNAGRVREALTELRRLAALHPKEALHHAQLADALLKAGLGDAARKEARTAVALEPKSALAQRSLGWALQHDLLGRRFRPGFDRAAALAAYRKARELDPKDAAGRGDLAILLEHDAEGVRYGPTASLAEAIAEYRALQTDLKEHAFDDNLLFALTYAGRFKELAETARGLERSAKRDQFLVLAAAAEGGADAGIQEAVKTIPDKGPRREAFASVAGTLVQLRLYKEAAAFFAEAAVGAPNPSVVRAQADSLRRTKKHEDLALPDDDARSVVKRFLIALSLSHDGDEVKAILPLFTREAGKALAADAEGLRRVLHALRAPLRSSGLRSDVVLDISISLLQLTLDGSDEAGYRVRMQAASQAGSSSELLFVSKEDGAYRLVTSGRYFSEIGREALRRAARGDLKGARQWLDWAREEVSLLGGDDPYVGLPFARFWTKGKEGDLAAIRLAAASLIQDGPDVMEAALPILTQARAAATADAERIDLDVALASTYAQQKKAADLLPVAERLAAAKPDSLTAFLYRQLALTELKRQAEAKKVAEERLALVPDDPRALRALASLSAGGGDYAAASGFYHRLVDRGTADSADFNNLAWNALFPTPVTPSALEEAVEQAQRSLDLSQRRDPAALHTLASLYAELGKTAEARELALQAMDTGMREEPEPHDWYVLGRIAEQYGEREAAEDAYRKVGKSESEREVATSSYLLAQRRLAALTAKPGKT